MGKYQAYPEYITSDIDWIEKLPSHWEISKLRYMFSFGKGLTITKANLQDDGVPCVNYGEVHSKFGFEVNPGVHDLKYVSENYVKTDFNALLSKGDLVFADTSEDIEGSGNFTQLVSDDDVFAGYHTIIARPLDRQCFRFYAYLLDSLELRTQIRHAVKGVKVFSITQAILRGIDIWLPSVSEREKIASFLDHETAKIDTLIEKQQQLIALLKEKRQAVISHAVTKGLNPSAPLKNSGVEWLGDVPEHWDVSALKYHVDTVNGFGFSSSDVCEEGVPFIRAGNIKKKSITQTDLYLPQRIVDRYKRVILSEGDIVISMVGSDPRILESAVGQIGIVPKSMAGSVPNQNIVILREKTDSILKRFLFYALCSESYRNHLNVFSHKLANQSIISSSLIVNAKFMLPAAEEQGEIIEFLDQRLAKFDEMVVKSHGSLELLKERRTALISAAVTGEIDVRNWQAPEQSKKTPEAS